MWLFSLLFYSLSQLWYVKVRISRSVPVSPLEFEITRVDCIYSFCLTGIYFCFFYGVKPKEQLEVCHLCLSSVTGRHLFCQSVCTSVTQSGPLEGFIKQMIKCYIFKNSWWTVMKLVNCWFAKFATTMPTQGRRIFCKSILVQSVQGLCHWSYHCGYYVSPLLE